MNLGPEMADIMLDKKKNTQKNMMSLIVILIKLILDD